MPEEALYAQIMMDIRRRAYQGNRQRFTRPALGRIGLAKEPRTGIADRTDKQNLPERDEVLSQTLNGSPADIEASRGRAGTPGDMLRQALEGSPADFERLIATLLTTMGLENVDLTSVSSDGGIDVRGTLVVGDTIRIRMAVQAKRWKANVGAPIVQQLRGSLSAHEQGLIITTSGFTRTACKEASRGDASPVALMDGKQLARLLAKYEIGV